MIFSERIRTALHQGSQLAARAVLDREGWYAWIWINPVMRSGVTYRQQREQWTLNREASGSYDGVVERYEVRYVEMSEWHLAEEWGYDLDIAMRERPVEDWVVCVESDEALMDLLARLGVTSDDLHHPNLVDYPDPPTGISRPVSMSDIQDTIDRGHDR